MSLARFLLSLVASMWLLAVPIAHASGPVVLTVEGNIEGNAPRDFTIADLEAMGVSTVTTSTPWHNKVVTFEGVLLSDLLEKVGGKGDTIEGVALNNFYTEIPVSDATDFGVLLAFKADGSYLGVRDKGPLFVIYPFDRFPELRNELYYSRSIWQLRRIKLK